ncbi:MAG: hypothetical protein OXF05_05925 [Hyphomicrobiales bacterium]|nr:hypothetical protein [Hyphomicrobiales bacterium]MCY4039600.1 hypothetical protein [Hyphomicrobiales bacterium]
MATEQLSVSLESDDRLWIDEAVRSGQIANVSVFISALIRDYRERVRIENLLAERLASGEFVEPDAGFWDREKEALQKQISK